MGTRMVKLALDLYDSEWIQWYYNQMKNNKIKLHPAVCFTMLGHFLGVDVESIIDYYLYQNISSLTQNAVRAIPLGQTAEQVVTEMIAHIEKTRNHILELDEIDFGMTAPGLNLIKWNMKMFMFESLFHRRHMRCQTQLKLVSGPVGAGKTQLIEKWLNALRKNEYWRYY